MKQRIYYSKSQTKGIHCVALEQRGQGLFKVFTNNKRHLSTITLNLRKYLKQGRDINKFKKFLNKKKGYKIAF